MNYVMRRFVTLIIVTLTTLAAWADSTTVHRVEVTGVPSSVIQNNSYLRGSNPKNENITSSQVYKLSYSLMRTGSEDDIGAYAGIGVGLLTTSEQMGKPMMAYILQGAPIINFGRNVSLNYELDLGVAIGWKHYEKVENATNHVLGSPASAYIGADVYFRVMLGRHLDVNIGYSYNHFSNANLRQPNEGFNNMGVRLSAAYYFNRTERTGRTSLITAPTMPYGKHWTWDITAFAGWKVKSLSLPTTFGVGGLSVNPMYRVNSAFAVGPQLDAVYDRSINLITYDNDRDGIFEYEYPPSKDQMALGLQAKAELTMPFFRASGGVGGYVVGGFRCMYETLTMKIDVTRFLFLNVGYCLYNYNYTNNLMLGIGVRLGA